MLTVGDLFAGVGGFSLGFEQAGFRTSWQVETENFPRRVLETRFPHAKRFNDIRNCGVHNLKPVDVITAGVPCQDVSVAGKRAGLAGERTGLFYEFARILRELRPAWFVFENVPGLFSSNRGRDFAEVLLVLMVECGYGISWRVLDSRFFGVAQKRRRVFIVGCFGKPCPPAVLFESEGCARNSTPRREAGSEVAYALAAGTGGSKFGSGRDGQDTFVVASSVRESDRHHGRSSPRGDGCDNLVAATLPADHRFTTDSCVDNLQVAATLSSANNNKSHAAGRRREDDVNLVSCLCRSPYADREAEHSRLVPYNIVGGSQQGSNHAYESERTGALQHNGNSATGNEAGTIVACPQADADGVRGFAGLPKGMDSARYRALGNAVTVSVAYWIATRIKTHMR